MRTTGVSVRAFSTVVSTFLRNMVGFSPPCG